MERKGSGAQRGAGSLRVRESPISALNPPEGRVEATLHSGEGQGLPLLLPVSPTLGQNHRVCRGLISKDRHWAGIQVSFAENLDVL